MGIIILNVNIFATNETLFQNVKNILLIICENKTN